MSQTLEEAVQKAIDLIRAEPPGYSNAYIAADNLEKALAEHRGKS